jgi:MFS family permease
MIDGNRDDRGLIQALVGDGRPLLKFTGLMLVLSGLFAFFLSATRHFLPHDVEFLGMSPEQLCAINECRIVHFMIHDRVSFGGTLCAIGILYVWLAEFPLKQGLAWSWWVLLLSGMIGFASFLSYLGYGYLDTWHGIVTLALLPFFVVGLILSYFQLVRPAPFRKLLIPSVQAPWNSAHGAGRAILLLTSLGLVGAGATIMLIGMTTVFVPQDLAFMGLSADELRTINARLVPLIAHDRAGFGGGVCTCGVTMIFCIWCGTPSKNLWQALCASGAAGFSTAIGIHPVIGYTDPLHLAPAVIGGLSFLIGLVLCYGPMHPKMKEQERSALLDSLKQLRTQIRQEPSRNPNPGA